MKRQALTLFLSSWLFFTLFHPGHPITVDSATTLQTVRALAQGRLDIQETMVTRVGREGLHYSYYGPLLPILSLPGYWLGSIFDDPPPPPGSPDVGWGDWAALNTNQWISAATLVVLFLIGVRAGLSIHTSLILSVICGMSTMILPYARDYFSQPLCALLLVVAGYGIIGYWKEGELSLLWAAAIAAALLPWARMDMAVVFAGLFLWVVLESRERSGDSIKRSREAMILSLPFLFSLGLLFLFDGYRWGRWSGSPYGDHSFNVPLVDSIPRFFFSPELSIFLYNPLLLLSFWFLIRQWKEMKILALSLIAIDLLYLLVIGKFRDYHGGVCPGPRYFLSLVPLNLIPLFIGFSRLKNPNGVVWLAIVLLVIVGIAMNGYETLVDYTSTPPAWDYWKGFLTGKIQK